jgi:hypothetical protein
VRPTPPKGLGGGDVDDEQASTCFRADLVGEQWSVTMTIEADLDDEQACTCFRADLVGEQWSVTMVAVELEDY